MWLAIYVGQHYVNSHRPRRLFLVDGGDNCYEEIVAKLRGNNFEHVVDKSLIAVLRSNKYEGVSDACKGVFPTGDSWKRREHVRPEQCNVRDCKKQFPTRCAKEAEKKNGREHGERRVWPRCTEVGCPYEFCKGTGNDPKHRDHLKSHPKCTTTDCLCGGAVFESKEAFDKHVVDSKKVYTCNIPKCICKGTTFANNGQYVQHMRAYHLEVWT